MKRIKIEIIEYDYYLNEGGNSPLWTKRYALYVGENLDYPKGYDLTLDQLKAEIEKVLK